MSFLALIFALLVEQVRPLSEKGWVQSAARAWVSWTARSLDAGQPAMAWLVWCLMVVLPGLVAWWVHLLLGLAVGWPVSVVWSMLVLYFTLGFRQFSHHFTDIRVALEEGDESKARLLFAAWHQVDATDLPRHEILRHVIEHAAIAAHRHVFGVLAWFSVGAALGLGPAGAVLYRMAQYALAQPAQQSGQPLSVWQGVSEVLYQVQARAWALMDWVPARCTAVCFAVVGNFEEAIDCWRQSMRSDDTNSNHIIIAATAGAINVQLGGATLHDSQSGLALDSAQSSESLPGRVPELAHMRSLVGLVWRSVVLWLVLLCLLTLAKLIG